SESEAEDWLTQRIATLNGFSATGAVIDEIDVTSFQPATVESVGAFTFTVSLTKGRAVQTAAGQGTIAILEQDYAAQLTGSVTAAVYRPIELTLGATGLSGMMTLMAELTYDPSKLSFPAVLNDKGTPDDPSDDYYSLKEDALT